MEIFDDLGHNATVGVLGKLLQSAMAVFLAAAVICYHSVVLATVRLLLVLAYNVILTLTDTFEEAFERCVGQRMEKDIDIPARCTRT